MLTLNRILWSPSLIAKTIPRSGATPSGLVISTATGFFDINLPDFLQGLPFMLAWT